MGVLPQDRGDDQLDGLVHGTVQVADGRPLNRLELNLDRCNLGRRSPRVGLAHLADHGRRAFRQPRPDLVCAGPSRGDDRICLPRSGQPLLARGELDSLEHTEW